MRLPRRPLPNRPLYLIEKPGRAFARGLGPLLGLGWRIHVEEQALRARFGDDYARYAGRSWALVPFVW